MNQTNAEAALDCSTKELEKREYELAIIKKDLREAIAAARAPHEAAADCAEDVVKAQFLQSIKTAEDAAITARQDFQLATAAFHIGKGWQGQPVGTVFYEVSAPMYGCGACRATGLRAVLEIWQEDSPRPKSLKYGIPRPGNLILRYLKADGTPGLRFDRLPIYNEAAWKPVTQAETNPAGEATS